MPDKSQRRTATFSNADLWLAALALLASLYAVGWFLARYNETMPAGY